MEKKLLDMKNISKTFGNVQALKGVSLDLYAGEVLALMGENGAGKSTLMNILSGSLQPTEGEIYLNGKRVKINSPKDAISQGIGFLTEDRKASGCFLPLSVERNTYIAAINNYTKCGFINGKKAKEAAENMRETLSIKVPNISQKMENLSGGNQQKVLIGRWLLIKPDILIIDEPTRGIDVGSKTVIHSLISELAAKGTSIIMISSEMPEVIGMSDRIIVLHEGEMMGSLGRCEFNQEKIMAYSSGIAQA